MSGLPWTGLSQAAARVDLWDIVARLGGVQAAAAADPPAWLEAGLPFDLLPLLERPRVDPGGRLITAAMDAWPRALRGVPFAPVALGLEGRVELLERPAVAVVGARACTPYGIEHATRIAGAVTRAGAVVVSGLARGIDRAAHLGAPGGTIAVLGQGLDTPMPAWQQQLRQRVVSDGGLILSEFPRGLPPDTWTFPIRNRIVAALARATVVVEASHRSGARNTANHALQCGRAVLAVPGPLGAPASEGCLDMIEDGALVVRGPGTVLAAAGLSPPPSPPRPDADPVVAALGHGATPEDLCRRTGLPHAEVMARLGALGLTGRVVRLPGNLYVPRGPP